MFWDIHAGFEITGTTLQKDEVGGEEK